MSSTSSPTTSQPKVTARLLYIPAETAPIWVRSLEPQFAITEPADTLSGWYRGTTSRQLSSSTPSRGFQSGGSRAQLTVLTGYQTSAAVRRRLNRTGPLAQIVYDYEFWAGGDYATRSAIAQSLSRPDVAHIATSRAVRDMLEQIGAPPVATVPPGVADRFRTEVPPHQRPLSIAFAYRREPHKGIPHLVAALERVHANHPRLPVRCFGSSDEANLPAWVEQRGFLTDKELVKFYNDCAIFVLPSHYEGWGLPAAEAMASGASVVVTACGGTADFTDRRPQLASRTTRGCRGAGPARSLGWSRIRCCAIGLRRPDLKRVLPGVGPKPLERSAGSLRRSSTMTTPQSSSYPICNAHFD